MSKMPANSNTLPEDCIIIKIAENFTSNCQKILTWNIENILQLFIFKKTTVKDIIREVSLREMQFNVFAAADELSAGEISRRTYV